MEPLLISYDLHKKLKKAVEEGMELPKYPLTVSAEVYWLLYKWNNRNKDETSEEK